MTCAVIISLLVFLPTIAPSAEPSGEEVAYRLRDNVVRITTEWADGNTGPGGFGLIVGEPDGYLYIVTAKHVVLSVSFQGQEIKKRFVTFRHHPQVKPIEADFVASYPDEDLALIKVEKPKNFKWVRHSMARPDSIQQGKKVWFVGRAGTWWVPSGPNIGTIRPNDDSSIIEVDINSVKEGTSGAPFITEDGIIGMIYDDEEGVTATAYSIIFIKKAFEKFNEWNGYPWSLGLFPPCADCPKGLVHWWPGDGDARDIFGNKNGLLLEEGVYAPGKVSKAFKFDGADAYFITQSKINITGDRPRSVSLWIKSARKYDGFTCCPTPFSWGRDAKAQSFGIFIAFGKWFFWGNPQDVDIQTSVTVDLNWNHHAITYDSQTVTYYINGKVVGSAPRKLYTPYSHLYLGRGMVRRKIGDTPFEGMIDEFQIFNRALSKKEVQTIYEAGRAGTCKD